jgi:hypothetical protein
MRSETRFAGSGVRTALLLNKRYPVLGGENASLDDCCRMLVLIRRYFMVENCDYKI